MIVAETKIRVRYADTDQMKMVYYAKFFEYFEQGRSDLLREVGLPYPQIEAMGFYLPVREAQASYLKPARYDDEIIVRTMLKEIPQARVHIEYEVHDSGTRDLLVEGYTIHGFISVSTGKPTRAPAQFLEVLREAFQQSKPIVVT